MVDASVKKTVGQLGEFTAMFATWGAGIAVSSYTGDASGFEAGTTKRAALDAVTALIILYAAASVNNGFVSALLVGASAGPGMMSLAHYLGNPDMFERPSVSSLAKAPSHITRGLAENKHRVDV